MNSDMGRLLLGLVLLGLIGWLTISVILPLAFGVIGLLAWPLVLIVVGAGVVYGWKQLKR